MTLQSVESARIIHFLLNHIESLTKEKAQMSANLDALNAASSQAVATMAQLVSLLMTKEAKIAEMQAELEAGASSEVALPGVTQSLVDAVNAAQPVLG